MRNGTISLVILALALLLGLVLKPLPRPKAQPMRVQAVNNVAHPFLLLPHTNTPGGRP